MRGWRCWMMHAVEQWRAHCILAPIRSKVSWNVVRTCVSVCVCVRALSFLKRGTMMMVDGERGEATEWRKQLLEVVALNSECVDCNLPIDKETAWASINLGIFMCIEVLSLNYLVDKHFWNNHFIHHLIACFPQKCSGVHRSLGVSVSQVRSVALDEWTLAQIAVMREIGNKNGNQVFERTLPSSSTKPLPNVSLYNTDVFMQWAIGGMKNTHNIVVGVTSC